MKRRIELVADVGESFGNWVLGRPEETMKLINTAMVACGYHAGDPLVMHQTVRWCKQYNVVLGAHPGFPDLLGFGRRSMAITPEEARDYIIYQVGALKNFADYVGVKIRTANPHGAFYSWATESEEHAQAVVEGLKSIGPSLEAVNVAALPFGPLHQAVKKAGLRLVRQIAPGLEYGADGSVQIKRGYAGDPEKEVRAALKLIRTGKLETIEGKDIDCGEVDSILCHGDVPNSPEILLAIKKALEDEGVEVRAVLE